MEIDQSHVQPKDGTKILRGQNLARRALCRHLVVQTDYMGCVVRNGCQVMTDHKLGESMFVAQFI